MLLIIGGGIPIDSEMQECMKSHFRINSRPAANRFVKFKQPHNVTQIRPVRYLDDNQREIFQKFPFKEQISFKTFTKYLRKEKIFKKPQRFSDL